MASRIGCQLLKLLQSSSILSQLLFAQVTYEVVRYCRYGLKDERYEIPHAVVVVVVVHGEDCARRPSSLQIQILQIHEPALFTAHLNSDGVQLPCTKSMYS